MEKKLAGYVLIFLGLIAMVFAGYNFIQGSGSSENITEVMAYLLGGAILFFTGVHFAIPPINIQKNPVRSNLNRSENA